MSVSYKIPKRLAVERACFYQLPDDMPTSDLTRYEIMFRIKYNGTFKMRVHTMFYFEFNHALERNDFLDSLEAEAVMSGLRVQRITIN
ncbi:hypothetical protein [Spirosoma oryzicola]|uniref:hypothetical protein n=1 Tax=Spirosoma oryzicola TaxID=2898794 RepID=UPI001E2ECA19|nr:hypothetical protein [Spirosoma oryzicola]UHG91782.1 hypothetical protein LQ777_02525 [Spirosoma oryzicola]